MWCTGVGQKAIEAIYEVAKNRGERLAETVMAAHADSGILPARHRSRLSGAIASVLKQLEGLFPEDIGREYTSDDELVAVIRAAIEAMVTVEDLREAILSKFVQAMDKVDSVSISDVLGAIETANEGIEQEIDESKVNILTMHRAKGLTAEVVIVAATEDQYIPGRASGEEMGDERRLLYVSLTRAKHHLFITYCDRRTGQQRHSGSQSGRVRRSLTRFLTDCSHLPQSGDTFVQKLA